MTGLSVISRRAIAALSGLGLAACGKGGGATATPPPPACGIPLDRLAGDVIDDVRPQAARGTGTLAVSGYLSRSAAADGGGGFTSGVPGSPRFTVLDAFTVAPSDGRPAAELFVFLIDTLASRQTVLGSTTLANLRTRSYVPPNAFALYAEQYDATAKDYTRWLVSQSGCVTIARVDTGGVARAVGSLTLHGTWQTETGAVLGPGDATATFALPVLRLQTSTGRLRDTLVASLTGARSESLVIPMATAGTIHSYQELRAGAPRFVAVAASPIADSTRELSFLLPGERLTADSVPLAQPTLDEARAARSSVPFAMLQVNTVDPSAPTRQIIRQLWPSSDGYVRFTNLVQVGPLALCGYATGRFLFHAAGTNPQPSPPVALPGTLTASGRFATVFTVLRPADSLATTSHDMLLTRVIAQSFVIADSATAATCAH